MTEIEDDEPLKGKIEMTDQGLKIEMTDEVRAQLAADPEMAAALQDMLAKFHQAHDAVKRGQHKTMDDALEALTGNRPYKIDDETGEVIEGASLNEDMGLDDDDHR